MVHEMRGIAACALYVCHVVVSMLGVAWAVRENSGWMKLGPEGKMNKSVSRDAMSRMTAG